MKIAIVGSGISGLGAAYLLQPHHEITIYEKNQYLGGHSRTVDVDIEQRNVPVDTGFIVFNYRNYPNLSKFFERLHVPIVKSNMSFGVSINNGWLEYGTDSLINIFAQKSNLLQPRFWKMLSDIIKFNRHAPELLKTSKVLSLKDFIAYLGKSSWFKKYYLLPMGGSIWSMPISEMLDFPAQTFIRFFENHGLLTINDQPQWYTVKGGSKEYVSRISEIFRDQIKQSSMVTRIVRSEKSIDVYDAHNQKNTFDQIILACHADEALSLLEQPTREEVRVLSAFSYQKNNMVLHGDLSFMPKRRKAWSSWVYLSESNDFNNSCISLSYWMNNLQPLATNKPIVATLNPGREPDDHLVFDRHSFKHPIFNQKAIDAQARIPLIQGTDRIWYCGAWQRYGFHEDGLLSAVNIARALDIKIPWQ